MPSPATLLTPREGRTQTDILGELARAQFDEGEQLRQRELVDRLPHSKGAVSNNVGKLADTGLVVKTTIGIASTEAALLVLYREHVDMYLARERADGPFDANSTRSTTSAPKPSDSSSISSRRTSCWFRCSPRRSSTRRGQPPPNGARRVPSCR